MRLHSLPLSYQEYYARARQVKQEIEKVIASPVQHLTVRAMQGLFRKNPSLLYQWGEERRVPADNNYAERQHCPTVIAPKTSFGSESDAGAETLEVFMTLVHTLAPRFPDPQMHFKSILDQLAEEPSRNPIRLLFPQESI
jgi:hypothetical protein